MTRERLSASSSWAVERKFDGDEGCTTTTTTARADICQTQRFGSGNCTEAQTLGFGQPIYYRSSVELLGWRCTALRSQSPRNDQGPSSLRASGRPYGTWYLPVPHVQRR